MSALPSSSPSLRRLSFSIAGALTLLCGLSSAALAQVRLCDGTSGACEGLTFDAGQIQRVPSVFRFQTKIAQRKFPSGDEVFPRLSVLIGRADEVLCTENFQAIQVQDNILNLEIGRNIDCELAEVLAENQTLTVKLCFGPESCIEGIPLVPVPYAASAALADEAERARRAHLAAQTHYAHRMTADEELFLPEEMGYGYFDFHSPSAASLARGETGYSDAERARWWRSGFVQWAPVRGAEQETLHIAAVSSVTGEPTRLAELSVDAERTEARGLMEVNEGAAIQGAVLQRGTLEVDGALQVRAGGLAVEAGALEVRQQSDIQGAELVSTGKLTVESATAATGDALRVAEATTLSGTLAVDDALRVRDRASFAQLQVARELTVARPTSLQALRVEGRASVAGPVVAERIEGPAVTLSTGLELTDGAGVIRAFAQQAGGIEVNPDLGAPKSFQRIEVGPAGGEPVVFSGEVTFEGSGYKLESAIEPQADNQFAFQYWDAETESYQTVTFAGDQCGNGRRFRCACGNDQQDPGEACDDGNRDNQDNCLNTCEIARCGDRVVQLSGDRVEGCDDGNLSNNDACTNSCAVARCGDSQLWNEEGGTEVCDNGDADNFPQGVAIAGQCRDDCTIAACGDARQDADEGCDDGDADNQDACRNDCQQAFCGDGVTWNREGGTEVCDDGDREDQDACRNNCQPASCGDGQVWNLEGGTESCDDGNRDNQDSCRNDCQPARCGDGVVWDRDGGSESCDDGNNDETDNCIGCAIRCRTIDKIAHFEGRFRGDVRLSTRNRRRSAQSCRAGGPQAAVEVHLDRRRYLIAETYDANFDTYLHLRSGCDDRNSIACNDDGGVGLLSKIERWLDPGSYFIVVDGFAGRSGSTSLSLQTHDCIDDLPNSAHLRFNFWDLFSGFFNPRILNRRLTMNFSDAPVVDRAGGSCGVRNGRQKTVTIRSSVRLYLELGGGDETLRYHIAGDENERLQMRWSNAGRIRGMHCVQLHEGADPHTWHDNYICTNRDIGMRWNSAGPIGGMNCTQIREPSDPHTWHDNYLCLPAGSPYQLLWSNAGRINDGESICVQVREPSDPHTWNDNYLCYREPPVGASCLNAYSSACAEGYLDRHLPAGTTTIVVEAMGEDFDTASFDLRVRPF